MSRWLKILFVLLWLAAQTTPVLAQEQNPNQPVYIVQPGDTLTDIAARFNVSVSDLITANNLANPNALQAGQQLVIPGLQGVSGVLATETVPFGESLLSLSRRYQIRADMLVRLNHITSPAQLFAGSTLIIPQEEQNKGLAGQAMASPGETLLELAAINDQDPWALVGENGLGGSWDALPGEPIFFPTNQAGGNGAIDPSIQSVTISPLPLVQGKTTEIKIIARQPLTLSGVLAGHELHFFPAGEGNSYVALQGINALADPGLYPLELKGVRQDGSSFNFEQMVVVADGNYPKDPPLYVAPETLDPQANDSELQLLENLTAAADPQRRWDGIFQIPVDQPICIKSWFGDRRSYNNGPYIYFHGGLDFGVCASLNIYAAAPGVVVFAGPLTVRGNATIIDHGWGIYTLYAHQSQIEVKVGDVVQKGQLIGQIGSTGRAVGPHLHFEVWVNGEEVDPQVWLDHPFP